MAGAFTPFHLLQKVTHEGQAYAYTNPEFGRLFLPRKDLPMPSPVWAPVKKRDGVLRVVLLGESAAAGFPHPEFNLARVIEHLWGERHPDRPIEVINLTMVAVNSHILRLFAREAMSLSPDAMILYAGHNEAIGPYGPASVFGRALPSLSLIRFNLWVRNSRMGRGMENLYQALQERAGKERPRWVGLDEFRDALIPNSHPGLDTMARHTRANFEDIIVEATHSGVRVLVALPAVNLTDWPPLASAPAVVDEDAAWATAQRGEVRGLTSAWQVYQIARRMAEGGDWDGAWPLYRLACDLDLYRFRADHRVREALITAAAAGPRGLVRVVDTDRALHEDNPVFLTDREYFCEHVHLTFAGRAFVCSVMVQGLSALLDQPASFPERTYTVADLAARMLFTPWDELLMWQDIWNLLFLEVFAAQPEIEERRAFIAQWIQDLRAEIEQHWTADRLFAAYRMAPADAMTHFIAGRILADRSAFEPARGALWQGLLRMPKYPPGNLDLARVLMALGEYANAEKFLDVAESYSTGAPRLPALRGELYARTDRLELARRNLEKAVELRPSDYGSRVNLANVLLLLKDDAPAMDAFAACLEINPDDPGVLNNYAWLLATSDRTNDGRRKVALEYIRRAISIRPDFLPYQATLAVAAAANGLDTEAQEASAKALAFYSRTGDTAKARELRDALNRLGVSVVFTSPEPARFP